MGTEQTTARSGYVKALQLDWLTPLYDRVVHWTMPEETFRRHLIEQAGIGPGQRVLDVGCGTGTLCIAVKGGHPDAHVEGIDGDARILGLAQAKARNAGQAITFTKGLASALPHGDATFDVVLSTLMLHHLTHEERVQTCAEVLRVLRPGGGLHVADWGRPHTPVMRLAALPVQLFDGQQRLADNVGGRLPELFRGAGFTAVQETERFSTLFGTLSLYSAQKPSAAAAG